MQHDYSTADLQEEHTNAQEEPSYYYLLNVFRLAKSLYIRACAYRGTTTLQDFAISEPFRYRYALLPLRRERGLCRHNKVPITIYIMRFLLSAYSDGSAIRAYHLFATQFL